MLPLHFAMLSQRLRSVTPCYAKLFSDHPCLLARLELTSKITTTITTNTIAAIILIAVLVYVRLCCALLRYALLCAMLG